MNKRLYARLAAQNMRKNAQFYVPYLLTILCTVAAFYITCTLARAEDLPGNMRYAYLSAFMSIGYWVIGFFAVIFLFYTNSFLMKRRKKELGLYNVLGLGKRHIACMLGVETLYVAVIGIVGGIALGMLLQKLLTLILFRLMHFSNGFSFYVSGKAIGTTALLFCAILFVGLLVNLRRIHVQNPLETMREGNAGEREPKTRWLLPLIGVASLVGGYAIALRVQDAMEAFAWYFVAVFLVIIGTYCLFTAVSITVLKALRANKKFYYRPHAFITISGMLYRISASCPPWCWSWYRAQYRCFWVHTTWWTGAIRGISTSKYGIHRMHRIPSDRTTCWTPLSRVFVPKGWNRKTCAPCLIPNSSCSGRRTGAWRSQQTRATTR